MTRRITRALCRRHAYDLCQRYGISTDQMAPLFGVSQREFEEHVRRDGLTLKQLEGQSSELTIVRDIMELLYKELGRLQLNDEEASVKTRLDAVAQLARTMDRVTEMHQKRVQQQGAVTMLDAEDLRKVLLSLDQKIEELAQYRAGELVRREAQSHADTGGQQGMADAGETKPAATV